MNDWQMIGRLVKNSEFSATGTQTGHETQRQRVNRSREPQDEGIVSWQRARLIRGYLDFKKKVISMVKVYDL